MKKTGRKSRRSVVLAIDASGYSGSTVSLAVQVARSTRSRLSGIFIEDEDLLQLTGLPFTREISLTTAAARPLEAERIRRAMRAVARRFQQSLEQEARDLKGGWSFATVRGRVREYGLQTRGQASCIITAPGGAYPALTTGRESRRILLVAGRSELQVPALEGLMRSLGGSRLQLTLIADDADDELTLAVARLAAGYPGPIAVTRVARAALPALLREHGTGFDYVLSTQREDAEDYSLLLASLRCPVLLTA